MKYLALIAALVIVPDVQAADHDDHPWYLQVGGAYVTDGPEDEVEPVISGALPGSSTSLDSTLSLNGRAGYTFYDVPTIQAVSLELEYEWFDEWEFDADVPEFGNIVEGEIDAWSLMLNAKLYPVTVAERVKPFVLLGGGIIDVELEIREPFIGTRVTTDDTEWAWQVGAGVDVYATERLALSIEAAYVQPQGDFDDGDFWTLGAGILWRF